MKREDVQAILETVEKASATFQKALKPEERELLQQQPQAEELPAAYAAEEGAVAESDFELATAADALGTLARQIESVMDRRRAALYEQALQVYYAAEELARDPAHADLIPHVETMRRAHESEFGRPIPPKKSE